MEKSNICEVLIRTHLGDRWQEAEFIGVFQYSDVVGASPMIGGHDGGTVAYPVAVVKMDGELKSVKTHMVRFPHIVKYPKKGE